MQQDKHWKTVKMGDTDEGCGLNIGCHIKQKVGGVVKRVGGWILGSGYDPSLNETMYNSVAERLKTNDVVLQKNKTGNQRLVLHKVSEGDTTVNWSLQEKIKEQKNG